MGGKEGRKLCSQLAPGLKNQKNVSWESILSKPYKLRSNVEVGKVVFSLARWLRVIDLTLSKESNMQEPEKEMRFLRDSIKRQTWD